MSDGGDSGSGGDYSDDGGTFPRSGRSESHPSGSVLRRAMRWETLVILLILLILATVAS